MPFTPNKNKQTEFARSMGVNIDTPDFQGDYVKDVLVPAFRTENTIGSFIARTGGLPGSATNPDFNPFDHFTDDEKLDEVFTDNASLADSVDEIDSVRTQRDRERSDRKKLAVAGADGFFATLGVSIIDPINMIPVGGTAYRTYRTGAPILTAAAATASVGAGSAAAAEAALHATQIERTYGESALNVAGSALLSGVIGSASPIIKTLRGNKELDNLSDEIEKSLDPEPIVARGGDSVGAMSTFRDVLVEGKVSKKLVKILGMDPLSRTVTSELPETRATSGALSESPIAFEDGIGQSTETRIKLWDGNYHTALKGHLSEFKKYRAGGGTMNRVRFNKAVGGAMRRNDTSDIPEVANASKQWRQHLYTPLKNRAVEAGFLAEDIEVTTAESYLNRLWDKDVITTKQARFVEVVSKWMKDRDEVKGEVNKEVQAVLDKMESKEKFIKRDEPKAAASAKKISLLEAQLNEVRKEQKTLLDKSALLKDDSKKTKGKRAQISSSIARLRNKSNSLQDRLSGLKHLKDEQVSISKQRTIDNNALIKDLHEAMAKHPAKAAKPIKALIANLEDGANLGKTKALMSAVRSVLKERPEVDYDSLSQEIATRIRGTPDGRLPYDYQIGENSASGFSQGDQAVRGALKKRSFIIPDEMVEDFLQSDVEILSGRYLKNVAPDSEIAIDFGDIEMTNAIKDISVAWDDKITAASKAGDDKLARKLEKKKTSDISDIANMRDRIRGTFGNVDSDNVWVRAGRVARDLNYLRFMGGVVASSIPDAARIVMAEGIVNTFEKGLKPLVTATKAFKVSAAEGQRYGVGTDVLMGGRSEIIADVADYSQGGTAFERGTRSMASNFGKINLMDRWTAGVKQLHIVTMQNRIIPDMQKGVYDKQLGQLGISKDDALNIGGQLKKYAEQIDGVWIANTKNWDNQSLANMYGGALRKESDRVIVIPGQEKPLFMSTELGKSIFQFRSFMFSATQRMTIAGIQGQDAHFMQGVVGLTTLGMMAYAFKQWDAGREISDDPKVWVMEGIDRSGVLGIIMEANNTIEKVSSNSYGLRPMLGTATPSSRFASRSRAEAFLGPTFGSLLTTTLKVTGASADGEEWKDSDTRTLRRLLPYQNLLIFRQAVDKMEKEL